MSNYVKTTDFAAKDALPTGNPGKVASGTQVDTEFNNIATAIATKEDTANKGQALGYAGLDGNADVERANLPPATAYTDTQNVFTANQEIEGSAPALVIDETDATANERTWIIRAVGGNLHISTATDASPGTAVTSPIVINRNGTVIDSIQLDATTVTKNGNTVWHAGNDGTGSGLDADLVDGRNLDDNATPSTVVGRGSDNRISALNFVQTSANSENPTVAQVLVTNGTDNILRKASAAHAGAALLNAVNVPKIAWGLFATGTGSVTLINGSGISSATWNSTGVLTINYAAAGFTAAPSIVIGNKNYPYMLHVNTQNSTQCTIQIRSISSPFNLSDMASGFDLHIIGV